MDIARHKHTIVILKISSNFEVEALLHSGEFSKRVRMMYSQLFVCRGIKI